MTKDNVLRHSSEFRQRAVDACDELLVQLAAKEARIAVLEGEKWIAERALEWLTDTTLALIQVYDFCDSCIYDRERVRPNMQCNRPCAPALAYALAVSEYKEAHHA